MSNNVVEGDSNNRSYYYCSFSVVVIWASIGQNALQS